MANNYYTPASLVTQTKARTALENSDRAAVEVGFDRLPSKATLDAGSVWFLADTGAADVYVVAMQKTATSYTDGMSFTMKVSATNTGACTVNVDGIGAKAIKLANTTDPTAGDLTVGDLVAMTYDADAGYFRILTPVRSIFNGAASMSDAEVKAANERNADTNAFTDAQVVKVNHLTVSEAVDLGRLAVTLGQTAASRAVTSDANGNTAFSEEVQAKSYVETVVALSGTTPTIDCSLANNFTLTTSGNTTFTFDYSSIQRTTNGAFGFTLRVTAGGTHTLTWPASVKWSLATEPDDPASGEVDLYAFMTTDGGTNWYGVLAVDAAG